MSHTLSLGILDFFVVYLLLLLWHSRLGHHLSSRTHDLGALMITSEIGGMTFTRSLLDTRAGINIFHKAVFDHHHVEEL